MWVKIVDGIKICTQDCMTRTGLLSSNITKLQIHLETYYTTIDVICKDKINIDREFETLKIIFIRQVKIVEIRAQ